VRDWGNRRVAPAPLATLFRSLEQRSDRFALLTLTRVGPRQWAAHTYCGCAPDDRTCRCAAGEGDSPGEALASLIQRLS